MSTQMTVRLSDESTDYIDQLVAEGQATSRAAALDKLARRARRRAEAEQDMVIYAKLRAQQTPEEAADEEAWGAWATGNAAAVWADLD